jgi:methylenetetrahydrofolate reductase (NADPH)
MERMTLLGPTFIGERQHSASNALIVCQDVTWGAGGSSADITTQIVRTAHEQLGLETCMHLTCTNMPRSQVHQALVEAKENGCENILALRGDPPNGQEEWTQAEGGFEHAIDLIRYIRQEFGDHFDIAIAGFPEGHPHAPTRELELQYVKDKVDAGASFIITQMFYDADGGSFLRAPHCVVLNFAQSSSSGRAT